MAVTRGQIRQEILKRLPSLGRALVADSITKAGPSLTQVSEYERQRAGVTSFEGQYVYRYNLADPDRWRRITTVDTANGIISVDGPSYADNTDMAYERLGIHPDIINGFIAEAQRKQVVRTNIALVGNYTHDLDMETSGTAYWDGSSGGSSRVGATVAKVTSNVYSGTQALQVTTTNASNVIGGEQCQVMPNQLTYMAFIFNATTLTGNLFFSIADPIAHTFLTTSTISGIAGAGWVVVGLMVQASANGVVQPQFFTNNSGDVYTVDTCFGPYQAGQTDFTIQTALNEAYKVRYVRPSIFKVPMSTAGFFWAESRVFVGDYSSPENFVVETFKRDAVPNRIRLVPSTYYPNPITGPSYGSSAFPPANTNTFKPTWLAMEAQVSDFEPLLTEASITNQSLDECASWTIKLLSEYIMDKTPTPYWEQIYKEYAGYAAIESEYRPPQPMAPQQRFHLIRA